MNTSTHHRVVDWHLVADRGFEDIEELNDVVQGWDFEFQQLKAGRSPAELLQFGRAEFMFSSFYFEQPYHQRGCTAADTLTIGLTQEETEEVTTPDGVLHRDDILCFPSGRELSAVSRPRFKGYSLAISEALLDEGAASCGLQVIQGIGAAQQVLHCSRSSIDTLRLKLRRVSRSLAQLKAAENSSAIMREQEFDLISHLLSAIAYSRPKDPLKLTSRKQIVLNTSKRTQTDPSPFWNWHRRREAVFVPWNMSSASTSTSRPKPI